MSKLDTLRGLYEKYVEDLSKDSNTDDIIGCPFCDENGKIGDEYCNFCKGAGEFNIRAWGLYGGIK